jgi:hypothetical protein
VTARLVFGVDPGLTGAIAALADGRCCGVHDMPTMHRATGKGDTIDGRALAKIIREERAKHDGAYIVAAIEKVGGGSGFGRQGTASLFNFGQNEGIARGVFQALDIDIVDVIPQRWKKEFELISTEKDEARIEAIAKFPGWAPQLARKKDGGRADAMLIGLYAELNECAKPRKVIREGLFRGFVES